MFAIKQLLRALSCTYTQILCSNYLLTLPFLVCCISISRFLTQQIFTLMCTLLQGYKGPMPANHPPVLPTAAVATDKLAADSQQQQWPSRSSSKKPAANIEYKGPFVTYINGKIWTADPEVCQPFLIATVTASIKIEPSLLLSDRMLSVVSCACNFQSQKFHVEAARQRNKKDKPGENRKNKSMVFLCSAMSHFPHPPSAGHSLFAESLG